MESWKTALENLSVKARERLQPYLISEPSTETDSTMTLAKAERIYEKTGTIIQGSGRLEDSINDGIDTVWRKRRRLATIEKHHSDGKKRAEDLIPRRELEQRNLVTLDQYEKLQANKLNRKSEKQTPPRVKAKNGEIVDQTGGDDTAQDAANQPTAPKLDLSEKPKEHLKTHHSRTLNRKPSRTTRHEISGKPSESKNNRRAVSINGRKTNDDHSVQDAMTAPKTSERDYSKQPSDRKNSMATFTHDWILGRQRRRHQA